MAITTNSALITEIRGKVGNLVFSRNASGPFVRQYVSPVQPVSPGQQQYLNIVFTLDSEWRQLSSSQQQVWIDYARSYPRVDALGNIRHWNGYQLFIKLNWWKVRISEPIFTAPVEPRRSPNINLVLSATAPNVLVMEATVEGGDSEWRFVRYASNQVFDSKNAFFRPDYRLLTPPNFPADVNSVNNFYSAWNGTFGPGANLISGRRIATMWRLWDKSTGWMSKGFFNKTVIE